MRKFVSKKVFLTQGEVRELFKTAENCKKKYIKISNPNFYSNLTDYQGCIPVRLRTAAHQLKLDLYDYVLIKGIEFDDEKLENTPNFPGRGNGQLLETLKFVQFLITAVFGFPFGWQSQQDGSLTADILPVQGLEKVDQGYGSVAGLKFHTEDPFHQYPPDYLCLLCLRNPTKTKTNLFPVDLRLIPHNYKKELFKCQYDISPDPSHLSGACFDEQQKLENSYRKISILYGNPERPFLRIADEVNTDSASPLAAKAYEYLCSTIQKSHDGVVLLPGDFFVLNNHRIAHGRGKFYPSYNGRDRWIQRILSTDCIRNSANLREDYTSPVIAGG